MRHKQEVVNDSVRLDLPSASVVERAVVLMRPPRLRPGVPAWRSGLAKVAFWLGPILILLLLKTFVLGVFLVPSGSMEATLQVGDRMLVQRVGAGELVRGDVVVFDGSGTFGADFALLTAADRVRDTFLAGDDRRMYVKRIIALGGDTVACCDRAGAVTVTPAGGQPIVLDEPYLFEDDRQFFGPVSVPKGHVWVMGDHRSKSSDSRALHAEDPTNGFIPVDRIQGPVVAIIWPFHRLSGNPAWSQP